MRSRAVRLTTDTSPFEGSCDELSWHLLRVTRHERLTTLAASVGCRLTRPLGVSATLMPAPRYSPWRLQMVHGYPGSRYGR